MTLLKTVQARLRFKVNFDILSELSIEKLKSKVTDFLSQ